MAYCESCQAEVYSGDEPNYQTCEKSSDDRISTAIRFSVRPFIVLTYVNWQVNAGCDVHVTDCHFNTALHLASRDGVPDIVRLLIDDVGKSRGQQTADIDVKGHGGVTALMLACQNGHVTAVKELLKAGANPDRVDRHRATALMYSILTPTYSEPCPALIKTLIRHNCNVDEPANVVEFAKFWKLPSVIIR
jgi:ankyrin repeat protein